MVQITKEHSFKKFVDINLMAMHHYALPLPIELSNYQIAELTL